MMKRNARPFVVVLLIFTSVMFVRSQHLNKESYEIYDAVIRTMFADDKVTFDLGGPKVSQFVIRDHTLTGFSYGDKKESWDVLVKPRFKQLSDDVIEGYELKAKTSIGLERKFGTNLPYKLISNKELDAFFSVQNPDWMDKKWKNFYDTYPGSHGYIAFSNIGFNKLKDQALVYFVHWCMALCGTGHYILLSKKDDRWDVLEHAEIWIS